MAKKEVERLLIAGGENKDIKLKYNCYSKQGRFCLYR